MFAYLIRRMILLVPTFVGISMVVFGIINFAPGGPVDREIIRYKEAILFGNGAAAQTSIEIPSAVVEEMRRYYGLDKRLHIRYVLWLWRVSHLDLGQSYVYQAPVWSVIEPRLKVSVFLGLAAFAVNHAICLPLGAWKAVKRGSRFDLITNLMLFLGYSVPGWTFGTLSLLLFGGGSFWSIFPLGGFRPNDWQDLDIVHKVLSQLHYMLLPVTCYMLQDFAPLTMLTRNTLVESLGHDYVRTALAKGLSQRRVVFVHAMRNSLIPIATGFGRAVTLILASSFMIEKIFNIDGMGQLGYTSILERDYPVTLGILVVSSGLMLLGHILSDTACALIDPRIRFR